MLGLGTIFSGSVCPGLSLDSPPPAPLFEARHVRIDVLLTPCGESNGSAFSKSRNFR